MPNASADLVRDATPESVVLAGWTTGPERLARDFETIAALRTTIFTVVLVVTDGYT